MSRPLRALTGRPVLLALLVTGLIAAMLTSPAAQARPSGGQDTKAATHASVGKAAKQARAERALDRVRGIFNHRGVARPVVGPGRNATLALRNLWRYQGDLSPADRKEAQGFLARPTDPLDPDHYDLGTTVEVNCGLVCVHWVETSGDAVPLADGNVNGIPDYVDSVIAEMSNVYSTYVNAGYRAPDPDGTLGGTAQTDIYLANIGPDFLYGYCTSDQSVPSAGPYNAWAYCVLDNDYQASEFPTNTPIENLQVTAAHEYFHATQFAYDAFDDGWFMEATATWAEDELYDNVDDNLQYLPSGPQGRPDIPLDAFTGSHQYGDWIFFRYLTEKYAAEQGGMPTLVRKMWERASGRSGAPDDYSIQAVARILSGQGSTLAKEFAKFADANRRPAKVYSEGAAYPTAPQGSFAKKNGWYVTKLDHLTSATGVYKPGNGTHKLRITVDLANKSTSPVAIVSVYKKSGSVATSFISLNSKGNGDDVFPFAKSTVKSVEITLVNASARFSPCWQNSPFSCSGVPVDENLTAKVKGAVK